MGYTSAVKRTLGREAKADVRAKQLLDVILDESGVTLDGDAPWDPQIKDPKVLQRIVGGGSMAIGESYMDGDWECVRLDELARRIMLVDGTDRLLTNWRKWLYFLHAFISNRQNQRRASVVADEHYNLDAGFFRQVLGETMVYSCAYWHEATSLDEAQRAKLDLICRKLDLQPNDRLLDIGCGWGSLANYAAEHYGCEVVGVSIANEQIDFANQHFADRRVQFICADYRSLPEYELGQFDKIVSVGMFEHVGTGNYRMFMRLTNSLLKKGGRFLLHTITGDGQDPWMVKYIFPNGMLPNLVALLSSVPPQLVLEDMQNLRFDYNKTLLAWQKNLQAAHDSDAWLLGERFYRMWSFYLLTSAGTFSTGTRLQVLQLLFTNGGPPSTVIVPR